MCVWSCHQAISKDLLYGTLDGTTLEWTDGIFTATLRQVMRIGSSIVDWSQVLRMAFDCCC